MKSLGVQLDRDYKVNPDLARGLVDLRIVCFARRTAPWDRLAEGQGQGLGPFLVGLLLKSQDDGIEAADLCRINPG